MCGIAGFVKGDHFFSKEKCLSILKKMADIMAHRGPDGEGFYVTGDMAFAHRRLSIIDIAGGAQPMIMPDRSAAVTFNGEIYNFRELRDDLKKLGHAFKTNSDTEVLLHAYCEYGIDFINRIDGMFAFAIWDNKEKM